MSEPRTIRPRARWWLWVATLAAVALLTLAVLGRDDGPTLLAVPADPSMSDQQAQQAAQTTVLAWLRERNAGHAANLRELTSTDSPESWARRQYDLVQDGQPVPNWSIVAMTSFSRSTPDWMINALGRDQGTTFTLHIENGRLRVWSADSTTSGTGQ